MRLRRTGDAATQPRKRGPQRSDRLALVNNMFREWSPRKRATYTRAMMMPFLSVEEKQECIRLATRANGSVNVSRLFRVAQSKAIFRFLDQRDAVPHTVLSTHAGPVFQSLPIASMCAVGRGDDCPAVSVRALPSSGSRLQPCDHGQIYCAQGCHRRRGATPFDDR
jgi:hypothetical protein